MNLRFLVIVLLACSSMVLAGEKHNDQYSHDHKILPNMTFNSTQVNGFYFEPLKVVDPTVVVPLKLSSTNDEEILLMINQCNNFNGFQVTFNITTDGHKPDAQDFDVCFDLREKVNSITDKTFIWVTNQVFRNEGGMIKPVTSRQQFFNATLGFETQFTEINVMVNGQNKTYYCMRDKRLQQFLPTQTIVKNFNLTLSFMFSGFCELYLQPGLQLKFFRSHSFLNVTLNNTKQGEISFPVVDSLGFYFQHLVTDRLNGLQDKSNWDAMKKNGDNHTAIINNNCRKYQGFQLKFDVVAPGDRDQYDIQVCLYRILEDDDERKYSEVNIFMTTELNSTQLQGSAGDLVHPVINIDDYFSSQMSLQSVNTQQSHIKVQDFVAGRHMSEFCYQSDALNDLFDLTPNRKKEVSLSFLLDDLSELSCSYTIFTNLKFCVGSSQHPECANYPPKIAFIQRPLLQITHDWYEIVFVIIILLICVFAVFWYCRAKRKNQFDYISQKNERMSKQMNMNMGNTVQMQEIIEDTNE